MSERLKGKIGIVTGVEESVTLSVKLDVPVAVGVPLISHPVVLPFSPRPLGSAPEETLQS